MNRRARRYLAFATLLASLNGARAHAADIEFQYDAGLTWVYTQDFLRTGDNEDNDSFASAHLGAGLLARTPRSVTALRYAPEYLHYGRSDISDQVDHRLGTSWHLRTGPLSEIEVRQGLSETSRQQGFQDFAGLGGNPSEPVTVTSRRVVWDVEPRLRRTTARDTTTTLEAIYREENYDLATLVDSRQVGVGGGIEKHIGRSQFLGGWARADSFSFGNLTPAARTFDRFIRAQVSWARRIGEQMSFQAGAGAYRSSGPAVESVVRPTLDLSGNWSWRRVYLSVAYELSYSSGGGISTSNRSQWGYVALTGTWGSGFEAGSDLRYIYRAAPGARLGEEVPLDGSSMGLHLSKRWLSGLGMIVRVSRLRQEREIGTDLDYREAAIGMSYAPPGRVRSPAPAGPGGPGRRVPPAP